jgi:hypothetical protein
LAGANKHRHFAFAKIVAAYSKSAHAQSHRFGRQPHTRPSGIGAFILPMPLFTPPAMLF